MKEVVGIEEQKHERSFFRGQPSKTVICMGLVCFQVFEYISVRIMIMATAFLAQDC